jgi:hypothetical protein
MIYKINGEQIKDWIILSVENIYNNVKAVLNINYTHFYCFVKTLRTKVLKSKELVSNIKIALDSTEKALEIIKAANECGFVNNYQAIARKYNTRKKNQHSKIIKLDSKFDFVCSIKYIYCQIIKQLIKWSTGPTSNQNIPNQPMIDIYNELELIAIDAYITNCPTV